MRAPAWIRPVTEELLGSALLVAVMFGSGAVSTFSGRYRCTAEAERLSCSRWIPGDAFSLSYAPSGTGQVRVRLEARSD